MKNATGGGVSLEEFIAAVVSGVVSVGGAIVASSGVLVGMVILTKSDVVTKIFVLITAGG